MKTMKQLMIGLSGLVFLFGVGDVQAVITFTDGFEAGTIDPFWNNSWEVGGTFSLSNEQAYTGSQSIKFESTTEGGTVLQHDFAVPVYGTFSVWMYDQYVGENTKYFQLSAGQAGGDYAFVGVQDWLAWDYVAAVSPSIRNDIPRGEDDRWHHLEITSLADQLLISIDGTTMISEPTGLAINYVRLSLSGVDWRPDATVYFDDFEMTTAPIPEPSTLILSSLLTFCGLALARCRIINCRC